MGKSLKNLHPRTRAALAATYKDAGLKPVIVQTLGNAPDSAGFHAADGKYLDGDNWTPYCAAIDFSVNQLAYRLEEKDKVAMNEKRIKWFLFNLAKNNIVGWYRYQGSFAAKHIHAIHVGVLMKVGLQRQVRDFLADRTGLVGHATEKFWTADAALDALIKAEFDKYN